jgi:hypothetical protein
MDPACSSRTCPLASTAHCKAAISRSIGSYGLVPKGPARSPPPMHLDCLVWTAHLGGMARALSDGHLRIGSIVPACSPNWRPDAPCGSTPAPLQPGNGIGVAVSRPTAVMVVSATQALGSGEIVQAKPLRPATQRRPVMFAADTPGAPAPLHGKLSPRHPRGLRHRLAVGPSRPYSRLGFRDRHPDADHRHRPSGLPRAPVSLPNRAMVGAGWTGKGNVLAPCPAETTPPSNSEATSTIAAGMPISPGPSRRHAKRRLRAASHLRRGQDTTFLCAAEPRRPFASVAFLASTFTYQAYANHARGNADAATRRGPPPGAPRPTTRRLSDLRPLHLQPPRRQQRHRHLLPRPILTMRPGFLTFDDPRLRPAALSRRHICWLGWKPKASPSTSSPMRPRQRGPPCSRPTAVLTGSHPEYHTLNTLDALQHYTSTGAPRLPRRQRLLLARRPRARASPHHRAPPRRGRHPRLAG